MSNIDRAAEVIAPWIDRGWGYPEDHAESAAQDLADEGLLKADPCHYVLPNIDPPIHSALGVRTQADCHDLWELPPHEDDEDWVHIWTDGTRFAITHEGEPVATMDRAAARQLISALTTVLDETPEVTAEGVGTDGQDN